MYDMIDPLPGALKLKMPGFSVAWTIVDLVMVSLRTLELPFIIAFLTFAADKRLVWVLLAELISVLLIAVTGLTGNIALLCRRHWALKFSMAASFFTVVSFFVLVWQVMTLYRGCSAAVLCSIIIGIVIFIMFRFALVVFNVISLVKAAGFFKERDGYL